VEIAWLLRNTVNRALSLSVVNASRYSKI